MGKKGKPVNIQMGAPEWLTTYSDMVTLLLCFFVAMFSSADVDEVQIEQMITSMNNIGMGSSEGGNTLSSGRSADLGNTVNSLPAMEKGKSLSMAKKKAVSLLNAEIKSNKVSVTSDERGVVISLASDAFFAAGSADIDIDRSRDILLNLAKLLNSDDVGYRKEDGSIDRNKVRKFRVEGHTDSAPLGAGSPWKSNWELSTARALNVLHYLVDIGVNEKQFQVAGFADTVPFSSNDTEEGRAYNRRVDLIILDEGHL